MRVAVLAGGRSSEHDVSLRSAATVRDALREAGHEPVWVEIDRDGVWRSDGEELAVRPGRGLLDADVAFPVLHGAFGEDGTVQGLLECLGVPYVGAAVLSSAVCMDKILFKDLMAAAGVPQVDYAAVEERLWREDPAAVLAGVEPLGFPVFVKPSRMGSSVGIARVAERDALAPAVEAALRHDPRVIVEAAAGGLEVECAVLGTPAEAVASEPGEIVLHRGAGWYDFEAKYAEGGMELVVPARIAPQARDRVRALALEAFARTDCSGLARVDFFVDPEAPGGVLLNELNTMPGQTETSAYGKLLEASGIPYPEAVDRLCRIALERAAAEAAHRY